ncbi:MAG TPA: HD domain-containing phosphohydrolase [Gaiellales bacterium]
MDRYQPPGAGDAHRLARRRPQIGETGDLDRFLGALESVGVVPFSGEFLPDGTWHAPYSGPGIHGLIGGAFPDDVDGGAFWESRVVAADRARYAAGMAQQRRGESCQMEYRIEMLDGGERWIRECARARPLPGGSVRIDGVVIDVSAHRAQSDAMDELEATLRVTRERLDSVISALDEYLYAWRFPPQGPAVIDFESIPQATFLLLEPDGGTPEEEWLRAVHPEDRARALVVLEDQATGIAGACEYRMLDGAGTLRWLRDTWTCRQEPNGDVVAEGIVSDVTVRRQAQDALADALADARLANAELDRARRVAERAAETDLLTGLASRRSFARTLDAAVADAARDPFALIVLDVDRFKRTNDTFGHQAGDDVLVGVVARMHGSCPANAVLGRWGGEEFTILLPGVRDEAALRAIADDIRAAMRAEKIPTWSGDIATTVSCGCVLSSGGRSADELLHEADAAMLRAKQSGRDRTLLARDATSPRVEDRPELLQLAETLAHAAGIRDGVAEPHSGDVAELAATIAEELDLPPATVLRCRLAGWLHDVGKIAIPDCVLAKPGPLDDEERQTMMSHAAFGADLVARTPGISDSAQAVRHHHERWDGKGYPDGLARAEIPIEARIVAAADTWHAMTQDRVYRSALSFAEAMAELGQAGGSQLDPAVTRALLAILRARRTDDGDADELAA